MVTLENKKIIDEFMTAYKELEGTLKDVGYNSVIDYENTDAPEDIKSMLQQVRIIRNGYSHNNNVLFVPISDGIKFLKDITNKVSGRIETAKDLAKRTAAVEVTNKIDDKTSKALISGAVVPVIDKDNNIIGGMDATTALYIISNKLDKVSVNTAISKDKSLLKMLQKAVRVIPMTTPSEDLQPNQTYIITDEKGKYKGIIQKQY